MNKKSSSQQPSPAPKVDLHKSIVRRDLELHFTFGGMLTYVSPTVARFTTASGDDYDFTLRDLQLLQESDIFIQRPLTPAECMETAYAQAKSEVGEDAHVFWEIVAARFLEFSGRSEDS